MFSEFNTCLPDGWWAYFESTPESQVRQLQGQLYCNKYNQGPCFGIHSLWCYVSTLYCDRDQFNGMDDGQQGIEAIKPKSSKEEL
jgi:hypothetical protein